MLKPVVSLLLISLATLAVIHIISIELYLYWQIWWLDIMMHLFGGAIIAFGVFTLYYFRILRLKRSPSLLVVMSLVALIAVSWEIFQYVITVELPNDYVLDTMTDIICGVVGGALGYIIGKRLQDLE